MISEKHFKINQALDIQRLFSFLDYINIYYSYSYNYKAAARPGMPGTPKTPNPEPEVPGTWDLGNHPN